MYLKAALLARVIAAVSFVFLAASCGGGGDGGGGSTQSPPASQPEQSPPASQPQQSPGGSGNNTCQPGQFGAPGLQVAQDGSISATFLSAGTSTRFFITLTYDSLGGQSVNNPQDKFNTVDLFSSQLGSQVGATTTVLYTQFQQPSDPPHTPTVFPKGTRVQVRFDGIEGPSTTGGIPGKDMRNFPNAQIVSGANNSVTVTFLGGGSISLSNVTCTS